MAAGEAGGRVSSARRGGEDDGGGGAVRLERVGSWNGNMRSSEVFFQKILAYGLFRFGPVLEQNQPNNGMFWNT